RLWCTIALVITRAYEPFPLPLLITGVAGVAGYNAFHYFRARYPDQVVAIRQEDNWPLNGDGVIPCNAEEHGRLRALFDEYQFRRDRLALVMTKKKTSSKAVLSRNQHSGIDTEYQSTL